MDSKEPRQELVKYLDLLHEDLQTVQNLNKRLDKLAITMEEMKLGDILRNYNRPRRVFAINFLAGLARGLGLTVGTAIVLAIAGFILSKFLSVPVIGEYISNILDYVRQYQ
ncbi:MAG: hypothetical protein H0Z33_04665 [Bacillaceae bacterium]|nr:hypothetical protein [Bacillaceae bacterium]